MRERANERSNKKKKTNENRGGDSFVRYLYVIADRTLPWMPDKHAYRRHCVHIRTCALCCIAKCLKFMDWGCLLDELADRWPKQEPKYTLQYSGGRATRFISYKLGPYFFSSGRRRLRCCRSSRASDIWALSMVRQTPFGDPKPLHCTAHIGVSHIGATIDLLAASSGSGCCAYRH